MKVKNCSRTVTYSYIKAGGNTNGPVAETVSVGPGETATLDVLDTELPRLQADIDFGELRLSPGDAERVAAAPAPKVYRSYTSRKNPNAPEVI